MSHPENLQAEMERIVREDGPWTAHCFKLPGGLQTTPGIYSAWTQERALFALRCTQLALHKPAGSLRVLDLGCLEGGIAIAIAEAGCEVVGLEIREPSLRKARFVAEALDVRGVSFVQGDMLRLAELDLGVFDLIVCAGTLYHVDAPALLPFLRSLNAACRGITVFDTHISTTPSECYPATPELPLFGKSIVEHLPGEQAEKAGKLWAAAENNHAFWPTERSLANMLVAAGFAQVTRPLAPIPEWAWQDRAYWVAYSSAHAEAVGLIPSARSGYLPEPDRRPVMCPTIQLPINDLHPNPNTQRAE
ncbi:MAG TPA: methyltransferase domain-containing protein [Hyphomicrobium sp.]|nr:methyltransferase domain-containing protein [Hyphomicrobium sp.]